MTKPEPLAPQVLPAPRAPTDGSSHPSAPQPSRTLCFQNPQEPHWAAPEDRWGPGLRGRAPWGCRWAFGLRVSCDLGKATCFLCLPAMPELLVAGGGTPVGTSGSMKGNLCFTRSPGMASHSSSQAASPPGNRPQVPAGFPLHQLHSQEAPEPTSS